MDNITSYAKKTFDTFESIPFGTIDSMVFSYLSYLKLPASVEEVRNFTGRSIRDMFMAEYFEDIRHDVYDVDRKFDLFTAMAASPRYRNVKIKNYADILSNEDVIQFSAMTFEICDDLHYVAFRGTDANLVGYKEDVNLAVNYPVPAQIQAAEYLDKVLENVQGNVIVGGHSKGGNLAIYAAAECKNDPDRVIRVYSHDGPGFMPDVAAKDNFKRVAALTEKTVPQDSFVGMLLESNEDYKVVKSSAKGIMEHDIISWDIENGELCYLESLSNDAKLIDETLSSWISSMNQEEKEKFVNVFFDAIEEADIDNFLNLGSDLKTKLPSLVKNLGNTDSETKKFVAAKINEMFGTYMKNVSGNIIDKSKNMIPESLIENVKEKIAEDKKNLIELNNKLMKRDQ